LLAACRGGQVGPGPAANPYAFAGPDFPVDAVERDEVVATVLTALDTEYLFPEVAAKNRPELAKRWNADAMKTMTSGRAIVEKMNADLRELFSDQHVSLHSRKSIPEAILGGDHEPTPAELEQMAERAARAHFGIARAEILDGNIGYLQLDRFPYVKVSGVERAVSDAMGKVANTAALIIDLRENGGGSGDTVMLYMSYLFDEKTLLSEAYERSNPTPTPQWTRADVAGKRYGASRPLFVLTSRRTFSAAEAFAYTAQTLKRGTIIGETTAGAGHFNKFVEVGKQFVLSVAIGMTTSPVTHTNWDGIGVKPDIATAAERALDVARDIAQQTTRDAMSR
jgi:hypothetical protein